MTHIALQERLDGKSVDWMEKVSDEEYRAVQRQATAGELPYDRTIRMENFHVMAALGRIGFMR